MMPPSFALWGVYQGDTGLIDEAYNQCRLCQSLTSAVQYVEAEMSASDRKNMRDSNTKLWRHVLRGNWQYVSRRYSHRALVLLI